MAYRMIVSTSLFVLQLPNLVSASQSPRSCKESAGSPGWPSASAWAALNESISGRLLQPPPPGAVCHSDQPTYNNATCPVVQAEWATAVFHQANPISNYWNNFNNDSCLPLPLVPCTGEGYPVYVVNATSADDVKKGVDFARQNNVRLVVKATGHDYLGRSVAPNSLSIWTHHLTGMRWHENSFQPQGCHYSIDTAAVTLGAGSQYGEVLLEASLRNQDVLAAGDAYVGVGGHLTRGGHASLSAYYGLAADNALEFEIVTPGGEILTINECQNQDLFWATRGGGGSTFGVITSATIKTFPSVPLHQLTILLLSSPNTDAYWGGLTYILSQYPTLDDKGVSGYTQFGPNITSGTSQLGIYAGDFILPALSPTYTMEYLEATVERLLPYINSTYPGEFYLDYYNATTYPSFEAYYMPNNGPNNAGNDMLAGSRLLPAEALTANMTALKIALQGFIPPLGVAEAYLVVGQGVKNAVPRGGSDAVNPAWRNAIVHSTNGVYWPDNDYAAGLVQQRLLTDVYVEAYRVLAPNSGAYINEADKYEPNFQQTFWGSNYPRLLAIKRAIDPGDVLWCAPCVGNERWEEIGDQLCRV